MVSGGVSGVDRLGGVELVRERCGETKRHERGRVRRVEKTRFGE